MTFAAAGAQVPFSIMPTVRLRKDRAASREMKSRTEGATSPL